MSGKNSHLYIWSGFGLFYSPSLVNTSHTHYAASLLHSFGNPIELEGANGHKLQMQTVFLPSNYYHKLKSDSPLFILQIDPDSLEFSPLRKFSTNKPTDLSGKLETISEKEMQSSLSSANGILLIRKILSQVGESNLEEKTHHSKIDYRIKSVISYLKSLEELPTKIPLSVLAKQASLSSDRFRHLFAEEMGLSIRRYLLWLRIRKAGSLLQKGFSLTDSAHHAGFTDSAHFSKTFKQNFGITPSLVLVNPNVNVKYFEL